MERRSAADPGTPSVDEPEEIGPVSAMSLDALALRVGHAINNPLAALLTDLDLAVDRLRDESGDPGVCKAEVLSLLGDVRRAAERVQVVVQRLRATALPTPVPLPAPTPPLSVARPVSDASCRRVRVLVVDDDALVGSSLKRSLRDYDVVLLDNAKGALERVAAGERFDVLFCDLMMPEMTGMDLHEEILRIAPDQAERMVFLTGGAVTTRARDFVEAVPNLVLDKPFDIQRLREIVRSKAK